MNNNDLRTTLPSRQRPYSEAAPCRQIWVGEGSTGARKRDNDITDCISYEWEAISMFSPNYKVWNDRWGLKGIASGREHEVLLDRRFGLCGSETRSRRVGGNPTARDRALDSQSLIDDPGFAIFLGAAGGRRKRARF